MDDTMKNDVSGDAYETPALVEFGSIEEWTQGLYAQVVTVSVIL